MFNENSRDISYESTDVMLHHVDMLYLYTDMCNITIFGR